MAGETACPTDVSTTRLRESGLVRRAEVREAVERVLVRPHVISRHFSIGEDGNEAVHNIVGECAPIVRVGSRTLGIIKEDVRQQSPGHPRGRFWRIPACVFERVGEDGDETSVVRGLRSEVLGLLVTGKKYGLRRPRAAVRLNPFSVVSSILCKRLR